ncbi:hypothetical protein J2X69_000831 [Algoriphagus sp. 4150]|uniref:DUF4382 domain-containing protein n=1 Tax=Algoriphagus sp. 4150 TaxID=2817756 RepID=UPI00286291FC|nr:DUF4382 domain-containing protein [Algoriphagus sp. 4150]MDR7128499.1 hypothetical protein [Algoriphagus sp. 4150]
MKKLYFYFIPIVSVLFFASCEDPDSSPKALLNVILVDAPAKWDSVFVEIEGVDIDILVGGREAQIRTFFLEYKSGNKRIKVSELVGGNQLLIGRSELPAGQITNAKIILGENHSMFLKDKRFELKLSDPSENEISLPTSITMEQGISYDLILDLDLEKSIIQVSESPLTYGLDPYFTLIEGVGSGKLSGVLKPLTLYPALTITGEKGTFSTHTDASGKYVFRVPEGFYNVQISAKDGLYLDTAFSMDIIRRKDSVLNEITLKRAP